jgi:hypothetical protein
MIMGSSIGKSEFLLGIINQHFRSIFDIRKANHNFCIINLPSDFGNLKTSEVFGKIQTKFFPGQDFCFFHDINID